MIPRQLLAKELRLAGEQHVPVLVQDVGVVQLGEQAVRQFVGVDTQQYALLPAPAGAVPYHRAEHAHRGAICHAVRLQVKERLGDRYRFFMEGVHGVLGNHPLLPGENHFLLIE